MTNETKSPLQQLEEQAANIRKLQANSFSYGKRGAQQFGRLEAEINEIYRKIDQLKKIK